MLYILLIMFYERDYPYMIGDLKIMERNFAIR